MVAWFAGLLVVRRQQTVLSLGTTATDSLVERFGTFTIIVLGEVVLSVVAGLVSSERNATTIVVGLLALWIGFGFWWIYFDLVGRRLPRNGPALTNWVLSHFPIALSIVAALVIGWLHPAPWFLALLLVVLLGVVWAFAVLRFLSADAWGDDSPDVETALSQRAAVGSSNAAENR